MSSEYKWIPDFSYEDGRRWEIYRNNSNAPVGRIFRSFESMTWNACYWGTDEPLEKNFKTSQEAAKWVQENFKAQFCEANL